MKDNLVGIVDVLQEAGFFLDDHYITVRGLLWQLASPKSMPPEGKV